MNKGNTVKMEILALLYKNRTERGPEYQTNLFLLAKKLSMEGGTFWDLYVENLIEQDFIIQGVCRGYAMITSKGVDHFRSEIPFFDASSSSNEKYHQFEESGGDNECVQIDKTSPCNTGDFLERFEKTLNKSSLPLVEKKMWLGRIEEIRSHAILLDILKKVLHGE
ncbi:MAG: hypothetical protein MRJ65_06035 [Candidatus Brocadiaceae bacterium]|nr:hypothetical protein [Candidatus Brocadiaceae bacterium]